MGRYARCVLAGVLVSVCARGALGACQHRGTLGVYRWRVVLTLAARQGSGAGTLGACL